MDSRQLITKEFAPSAPFDASRKYSRSGRLVLMQPIFNMMPMGSYWSGGSSNMPSICFIASGSTRRWLGGLAPSKPPQRIVEAAFGLVKLQRPSGLYNWAGSRLGEQRVVGNQIEFQPYFDQAGEFVGAHFEFQALQFFIWLSDVAPRADISGTPLTEFYHHMGGLFQAPPLGANFNVHWS